MSNIFISYDRGSQPLVETLADDIKGLGHTVWFDQELSGGQSWWDQILENVRNCEVFVFALSPRALESVACTKEYEYAYALGKTIVPVLITEGVSTNLLPEALSQIHYVDFRNPDEKAAALRVSKALSNVPSSNPLTGPLAEPPEVPLSYLSSLAKRVAAPNLSYEEQTALIVDTKSSLHDPATACDAIALLKRLKQRQDLFAKIETEINGLLENEKQIESVAREVAKDTKPAMAAEATTHNDSPMRSGSSLKSVWLVTAIVLLGAAGWASYVFILADFINPQWSLTVTTEPSDAQVTIVGSDLSYNPGMRVASGEYQVQVSAPGFETRTANYNITEDYSITITLKSYVQAALPGMVTIPAGSFAKVSNNGNDDETPFHTVSVGAFRLSNTEVTFAHYDAYVEATGTISPTDQGWGRGSRPVINVSWNDIQDYLQWLNGQTGASYRLPNEAEWEYAARAGTETAYWWGDDINQDGEVWANCNGCGSEWDGNQTAPVGSFTANAFGLHDMNGNVWEWVQDCYVTDGPVAGGAPETDNCFRIVRGGSWYFPPGNLRSAYRGTDVPTDRFNHTGFRLAQDL